MVLSTVANWQLPKTRKFSKISARALTKTTTLGQFERQIVHPRNNRLPRRQSHRLTAIQARVSQGPPPVTALDEYDGPAPLKDSREFESTPNKSSNPVKPSTTSSSSLFGAIALITGSTVGAGMLALPAVTAPAGFAPTAVGLSATWALLAVQALLMAEVNLAVMEKHGRNTKIVTLRQMAEETLGAPGKTVTIIYLLLSYCLLVAYLAKASEVLDFFAGHALSPETSAVAFITATASLFLFGGPMAADKLNQALTAALMTLFTIILGAGFTQYDVASAIGDSSTVNWVDLPPAVPIMFLSLVYHDLVPLICSYLGGDRKLVRTALVLGSLVPLGMFMSWEAVALSVGSGANGFIDPLQLFMQQSGPIVGSSVQAFSFLAVFTSFLGTVMGLTETLRTEVPPLVREAGKVFRIEAMKSYDQEVRMVCTTSSDDEEEIMCENIVFASDGGRSLALALALLPPLAFTAENPDAFLSVLSVAGGYGMTALYGIMPPLMVWQLRSSLGSSKRMMPGGAPVLMAAFAGATGVGISRLLSDYGGIEDSALKAAETMLSDRALGAMGWLTNLF